MPEYNEEKTAGRKRSSSGTRTNKPYRNSSAKTVTCEEMTSGAVCPIRIHWGGKLGPRARPLTLRGSRKPWVIFSGSTSPKAKSNWSLGWMDRAAAL